MESAQERVMEFHEAFDLPRPELPTLEQFTQVRCDLILEEYEELCAAFEAGDIVEMIDALCDLEYVVYGAAVALGVDLEKFSQEVHRSNMSKRWACGDCAPCNHSFPEACGNRQVKYRADGKVLKSPDYSPADIKGILEGVLDGTR